jgi:hypothetical protein
MLMGFFTSLLGAVWAQANSFSEGYLRSSAGGALFRGVDITAGRTRNDWHRRRTRKCKEDDVGSVRAAIVPLPARKSRGGGAEREAFELEHRWSLPYRTGARAGPMFRFAHLRLGPERSVGERQVPPRRFRL